MAVYDYQCLKCGHKIFDITQPIKDKPLTKCDLCNSHSLERVIHPPTVFVKDVKTIGQLADKNASMNRSQIQEQRLKTLESKPKQESGWQEKHQTASKKEINKMTKEQQTKYIITGEK